MDFLHSGVADYASWVIAYSGGEGEGDSIKEIDDILRAYACAFRGGRLSVVERLGRADEDFRILFTQVQAHSNRSQPASLPNLVLRAVTRIARAGVPRRRLGIGLAKTMITMLIKNME
jgi:hypothetical protein